MQGGGGYTVVTPEAVGLDLATASVVSRALARLIDVAASVVFILLAAVAAGTLGHLVSGTLPLITMTLAAFIVVIGYPVVCEAFSGRTLGKAATGLRVVRLDGGPIGLREACIRGALGLIEIWGTSGSLALLVAFFSRREQRLGDMFAGTLVLRRPRGGIVAPARFSAPPGTGQLVATLDVGAMTPADYEVVRTFLLRWADLGGAERQALAARIATPLWQRYRHALPAGMGPDIYLACLGSAYQLRHPPAWGSQVPAAGPRLPPAGGAPGSGQGGGPWPPPG